MKMVGTKFQYRVWNEIKKIPRGKTVFYKYITKKIGKPQTYNAVANLCAKNPLPIPCHSIIRQNGETGKFFEKQNSNKKSLLRKELI